MQTAVIIVNYRTPDLTVDCLKSLQASKALPPRTQVLVVDGNSSDNSVSTMASAIAQHGWADWVTLLPLDVNGGFAYANNRGIEAVVARFGKPAFFWLLNADTVVRPGALSQLRSFMEAHPRAGLAGSRLEDINGTPQHSAFRFHTVFGELEGAMRLGILTRLLQRWCIAPPIPENAVRMGWVAGASMLIRAEVLDAIGKLDEDYFMYYEETDFCLRAARAGWECWYVPESRVVHLVGGSSGVTSRKPITQPRPAYWFESRRRYFVKNHGLAYAALADLAWSTGYALWRIRRSLQNKPDSDPPRLLRDFLGHSVLVRGARFAKQGVTNADKVEQRG